MSVDEHDGDFTRPDLTPEQRSGSLLRIFGPPGTGKTTTLASAVRSTVRERGAHNIVIASFSVTAAKEIAGRRGMAALPRRAIGTLHSHAFRAIGQPAVALDKDVLSDWNADAAEMWKITGDSRGQGLSQVERTGTAVRSLDGARTGDELIAALDLLRASQVPPGQWPPNVISFAKRWTAWKRASNAVDFTDMIVEAFGRARDGEPLPGNPEVLILDEAQDFTRIETALALRWAGFTDRTVFALDDDQAINEWRGGTPELVLAADAEDRVLSRSYRVPPAVHAVAQAWISQAHNRVPKEYQPRDRREGGGDPAPERWDRDDLDAYGTAYRAGYALNSPMLLDALERDLAEGRDCMVLASCGYMLVPLIKELRLRGLPFHNPFRPADTSWNPLGSAERTGMTTAERVFRFLVADTEALGPRARLWTGEDVSAWSELVSLTAARMRRGAANAIANLPRDEVPWEMIEALFADSEAGSEALYRAVEPDLEWLASVIKSSKREVASYPLQVARSRGPSALEQEPQVVIGTLHSVKGGTASRVYLSPDLSPAGLRQWSGPPEHADQTRRLFYVGMTRAFHDLILLSPSSTACVDPSDLLPPHLEVRR